MKFTLKTNIADKCYEMFHFHILGPISVSLAHGHKYFLNLDDHSIFTWIILCKSKSEILYLIQKLLTMIET